MLLYFVLQLKPQSDCVSVTLKGQREQHVICTRSVKEEEACKLVNTHGAMASPKAKNRRHPLYNAGLSREDAAASPAGAGSTATYVHSSLWVAPALAPGSVHLERRREEGNAHRQRRSPFPLVLTTALNTAPDIQCSQRPQPPGQEKKKNRPANDTGKSYLHGRGERGKKKDEAAPRKVSPAPWWLFCTTHTTVARCTAAGVSRKFSKVAPPESRLQHFWLPGPPTALLSGPTGSSGPVPLASRAACTRCGLHSSQPVEAEGVPLAVVEEEAPPVASSRSQPTAGGLVASGPVAGGLAVGSPVERRREVARHPVVQTRDPRGVVVLSHTSRPEVAPDQAEAWPAAFPEVEWRTRTAA